MGIHQAMFFISGANNLPNTSNVIWIVSYANFGPSSASLTFATDGQTSQLGVSTNISAQVPNWYTPTTTGIGSSYWVRAQTFSLTSGAATSGSLNTWLALSTTRTWEVFSNGQSDVEWAITFEFATDSAGTNIVGAGGAQLAAVDTSA
jgi:hypothetical protein